VQAQFSMLKRMCDVKFSMLYGHFTGILRVWVCGGGCQQFCETF
jgi:hypothetical protein